MERFIRSIHKIHPLPEADLQRLLAAGVWVDLPKGGELIREGETDSSLYLLKEGVLKGYHCGEQREAVIWFVTPGEAAFSSWSYVEGSPARVSVAACCDSVALKFSRDEAEVLFASSPELSVWGRRLFERLLLVTDLWLVEWGKPLASQRYLTLAEKMPELLQNVPLKDIAAYLGVTPQSLSRIRASLVKRE